MKRVCTALLALSLCAGLAQALTNVPSKNAVGYVKVDLPGAGINLVALNFRSVGGNPLTLQELFGSNTLKQSGFFTQADQVSIFVPDPDPQKSMYQRYFQKPDGFFYNTTNTAVVVNPELPPGQSFWLDSGSAAGSTNSIFLMGEVVGAEMESQTIYAGLNPLKLPFASEYALSNKNWLAEGATGNGFFTLADTISVWDSTKPGGGDYDRYFLKPDGLWYNTTNTSVAVDVKIPVGVGAWYEAVSTFTSETARVYSYPAD